MSARSIRIIIVLSLAALAAIALPTMAFAGEVSAVDAVASAVAKSKDASVDTSSKAAESPSTEVYSGGEEKVPPPVDCGSTKGSSGDPSIDGKTDVSDSCTIVECSEADTDGLNAAGEPCNPVEECSAADTDGLNAAGEPCVPEKTCEDDADAIGGGNAEDGIVCGGGGVPEELPVEAAPEPVAGGGAPAPAEAVGGGAPELPFTGLPLWYAAYAGLALLLFGGTLWARQKFGNREG